MCDRAGQGGGISYMEREADHNECGKDGCCSGWTFLALTQWSELARVPTGPGIMVQSSGLLVGLVWGGGIPEFQPGWSGMATPPHLAPRQCNGPNQQDTPWQAYLINGWRWKGWEGQWRRECEKRNWRKLKSGFYLESQSHVRCTIDLIIIRDPVHYIIDYTGSILINKWHV